MSFLQSRRLFGKPVHASSPGGYLFDALMLLFLFVAYLGYGDLQAFGEELPIVTVQARHSSSSEHLASMVSVLPCMWRCYAATGRHRRSSGWFS